MNIPFAYTAATLRWIGLVLAVGMIAACNPPVEVPADAESGVCSISAADFANFFQSGTVTLNGVVKPPVSLAFSAGSATNCPFYQWAEQAFLWVTSPAPSAYDANGRVFESPVFFDVSPPDMNGMRTLIPHIRRRLPVMAIRAAQAGPHGLPVIMTRAGRMLEVVTPPTAPDGKPLVLNRQGQTVEIEEIRGGADGRPVFVDKDQRIIDGVRPIFPTNKANVNMVERFIGGHSPIFLNAAGDIVDVGPAQDDGGVLMTQGNSLVYYLVMVNDVYAYLRTGTLDGQIVSSGHFPTSHLEMSAITAFAATKNVTLPDSAALAIELKTSWVLASSVPNPADYFTITAVVPHYSKTSTQWTLVPNIMDTVKLAMIGIHVVGSLPQHPEMVWSTFLHTGVAPNATYAYLNTSSTTVSVPANTAGNWLLCANGAAAPYNQQRMRFMNNNIVATSGNTIGPSNVMGMKPWGAASDLEPNPTDASPAMSNSEIISLNDDVLGFLVNGDLRKNYIFKGATWTDGEPPPPGLSPSSAGGLEFGTSSLANVTMETFEQGGPTISTGTNCFTRHQSANSAQLLADTGVSHIFSLLKPLF